MPVQDATSGELHQPPNLRGPGAPRAVRTQQTPVPHAARHRVTSGPHRRPGALGVEDGDHAHGPRWKPLSRCAVAIGVLWGGSMPHPRDCDAGHAVGRVVGRRVLDPWKRCSADHRVHGAPRWQLAVCTSPAVMGHCGRSAARVSAPSPVGRSADGRDRRTVAECWADVVPHATGLTTGAPGGVQWVVVLGCAPTSRAAPVQPIMYIM